MSDPAQIPQVDNLSLSEKDASASVQQDSGYATSADGKTASTRASDPTGPLRTPLEHPNPETKPVLRPDLSEEQAKIYADLLATVEKWTDLPTTTAKNAPREPLNDTERMWLTRECLLRYLIAVKWNPAQAPQRLQDTIVWRREFKVDSISPDHVSVEGETGKQFIFGFDVNARPVLYMNPGRQNTKKSDRQIEHMVYMLERAVDLMQPGQEKTCLLISFRNATSGGSPSMAQGKQVLGILQNHYPERLGKACVSELPWFINTFFKLITPLIDPVTREKIAFNDDLKKHVPGTQLDKAVGGEADFEYEHDKYWPALVRMCESRRAAFKERWIDGGKRIGEYEAYIRGGDQKPLKDVETKA